MSANDKPGNRAGEPAKRQFIVSCREVWVQGRLVEAASEYDAIGIVNDGGGEVMEDAFEYSHTLEPEYWTVERPSGESGGTS